MISASGEPLYVGKAHNLRKRVSTYARPDRLPVRLQRMVAETASMEFVTCAGEVEALLLENNLIKRLDAALQCAVAGRQDLSGYLDPGRS
jgi:excinuclease ABC subunit C